MRRMLSAVVVAALGAGCTLDNQAAPTFSGPSGLGFNVTVTATPSVLAQDGVSQSTVEISATDVAGQPLAGRQFFVEGAFDFKVLKATNATDPSCPIDTIDAGVDEDNPALVNCRGFLVRSGNATIMTDGSGRASTVLSAPPALGAVTDVVATVTVTPVGGSFGDDPSYVRTVHIRLTAF